MGEETPIPAEVISEIIEKTRIEKIIQRYIFLEKDGKNLRGNCPIHPDQDKSFKVLPHLQMYRCEGCGAMGNALVFLQEHDQLTMEEAARELADEAGIELLAEEEYKRQRKKQIKQDIYSALQDAAEFYHKILATIPECSASARYLKKEDSKKAQ